MEEQLPRLQHPPRDVGADPNARYRNPGWQRDELILALDLYLRRGPLGSGAVEVKELSDILRAMGSDEERSEPTFRNANAVALRLANYAALDPSFPGRAMRRAGRAAIGVWTEFAGNTTAVADTARDILRGATPPELADAIADADEIANPTRRLRGQGRRQSPAERREIELHAMSVATTLLQEQGYDVEDVSATKSYDLDCVRDGSSLHVEVKGTTSRGDRVFLTRSEVRHAEEFHPATALILVSEIELIRAGESVSCTGGRTAMLCPWAVDEAHLTPLSFEYRVPTGTTSDV